ncbi:MAG TPA: hypothetical protein VE008_02425 [Burkholderiales bacterium]|nr:hypothetical protein [Burkholderiales bacterium]
MAETTTASAASTTTTGRGVGYPAFSLEEALARARKFWESEKKNAAPVSAAVSHWGYGDKSSGGKRAVAALIQFSLMSDAITGTTRTVKLTDRALNIVLSEPGSDIWMTCVREAAVSPKIYSDILNKWTAQELPSDATLTFYLLRERNFNPGTVVDFIKDFRATVAYAKLNEQPRAAQPAPQPEEAPFFADTGEGEDAMQAMGAMTSAPVASAAGIKQDVFSLDEGQVVLRWPSKMSAASYQDFKEWIDLQVRKIGRAVEPAAPQNGSSPRA